MTAWELFGSHSKCTWFPLHLAKYFNSGKKYHKIAHSYLLWNFLSYLYKDSCTWLVRLDPSLIRPASIETSQLRGNTNKAAPLSGAEVTDTRAEFHDQVTGEILSSRKQGSPAIESEIRKCF